MDSQVRTTLLLPPPTPSVRVHHVHDTTSFPILAILIVGILTTALLLLSYYIFVTKCRLIEWHHHHHHPDILLRRLSGSGRNRLIDDRVLRSAFHSTSEEEKGVDESVIQAIPTLRFGHLGSSFHDCAVCLNEFQEEEKIRMLPNCYHVFHIDCIDTWLQSHSNCPICRNNITTTTTTIRIPVAVYPNGSSLGDSLVIEVRNDDDDDDDEGSNNQETETSAAAAAGNSATTTERRKIRKKKNKQKKKKRKLHKVAASLGDECIDDLRRKKDKEEEQQPIMMMMMRRRSFSMDSMGDRQLFMAVQEILQQNSHFRPINNTGTSSSSSSDDGGSSSSSSSSSSTNPIK